MKKNSHQKTIIWIFLIISIGFLSLPYLTFAQDRQLEINYPEIFGIKPGTVNIGIATFAKYIFNFVIIVSGLIAFVALVLAGIHYSTSIGRPEEIKKAKDRIKSALLGMLILLFSYLILTTLNPQLTIFRLPGLAEIPETPATVSNPVLGPNADIYDKIRALVNDLSAAVAAIESQVNSLSEQLSDCDCSNANSMCICQSSDTGGIGGIGGSGTGGGGGGIGGGGGMGGGFGGSMGGGTNCNDPVTGEGETGGIGGIGGIGGGGTGIGGGTGGGIGGSLGGGTGFGEEEEASTSYSLDYCGSCKGLYCYNAIDEVDSNFQGMSGGGMGGGFGGGGMGGGGTGGGGGGTGGGGGCSGGGGGGGGMGGGIIGGIIGGLIGGGGGGGGGHICPTQPAILAGQQTIISLKDRILYYKNRILAEKEDLLLQISQLDTEINYYAQKIAVENNVLQQLQEEGAKKLEQDIISVFQEEKTKAENEKSRKQNIITHFDELAKPDGLIDQLAAEIPKTSDQIDACLKKGVQECRPCCSGGCHDTLGCEPEKCSGGTPSVCAIDNLETIQDLKSQIDSEIQAILDLINQEVEPTPPASGSCESSGGTCVGQDEACPSNYSESSQYTCEDSEKKCCMSTQAAVCQCSQSPYNGCVNLQSYGISYKDGAYTDRQLADKLVTFKNCLSNRGITGWRVTEACPPVVTHQSSCHSGNGKCVDVDSGVLCQNQAAVQACISQAGFSSYLNECSNANGPHFHINY